MATRQRLALGFGGAAIVLAVLASVSLVSIQRLIRHQRGATQTGDVIAAADDLLTTIVDAEAGQRGYILTGEERFLESLQEAARVRHAKVERLRALTAPDAGRAERLDALSALLDQRLRYLGVAVELRRDGKRLEAEAVVAGGGGGIALDRIRTVMHEIRAEEEAHLRQRSLRAESQARSGLALIGLLGSSGVLLLLAAGIRIRRDLEARQTVDDEVRQVKDRLAAVVDASPLPIVGVDADRRVIVWNPGAERLFGWRADEVIGGALPFVPPGQEADSMRVMQRIQDGESLSQVEVVRLARDGTLIVLSLSAGPLHGADGSVRGVMAVLEDIRERKRAEEQLARDAERLHALSFTDELTGLHNRRGFQLFGERSAGIAASRGERLLLVFADVDRLKDINDALGHAAGDRALCEAATVLRDAFGEGSVVARMGGDEFAALARVRDEGEADALLLRLEDGLRGRALRSGRSFDLSLSVGSTLSETEGRLGELLSQADAKMYRQKPERGGRGGPTPSRPLPADALAPAG